MIIISALTYCFNSICMAAEQNHCLVNIYNLNLMIRGADINADDIQLKLLLQNLLDNIRTTASGIIYVSQYPHDLTNVLPHLAIPFVCAAKNS